MDHVTPFPTPPPFLQSPIGIALLMLVSSIGGGWIKDRISTETRDTSSAVQIEAINKRMDDIREDLRDIKTELQRIERTGVAARQ